MPDPAAPAAGFPAWALLSPLATFGEYRRNHTTAHGQTSANRAIEVSMDLAAPPNVSRWFVHRTGRKKNRGFHGRPHILNSSGAFVLMRMSFYREDGSIYSDCFVYNAGGGGPGNKTPPPPSLDLIPGPCPTVNFHNRIAILPATGGEHYSVVFPVAELRTGPKYEIKIFSSADQSWRTKFASISADSETTYLDAVGHHPSKAVAAGRGSVAWIDLWRGVLLCEGLDGADDDEPVLRLIKWPVPLPCRNAMDLYYSADASRDATLSVAGDGDGDGGGATVRFVEMKFQYSCSCQSRNGGAVLPIGWTATVWKRRLCSSSNSKECSSWEKCHEVDIAKILRGCSLKLLKCNSTSSFGLQLLRKVWDAGSNKLDLNKVSSAPPTLSLTDEDVVYFMTNLVSKDALVIAVDARKKKLEAVSETSFELDFSPCSFSGRLLLDAAASSGTDDDMVANGQSDECDGSDDVDCLVTNLQAALDELKDIEEHLEIRKPWYSGIAPLCADGSSSSSALQDVVEAVAPCFSVNNVDGNNSTRDDVVDLLVECFRELGDLKARILAPVEEMKNKVSLALGALDTLQNGHMSNDRNGAADAEHVF